MNRIRQWTVQQPRWAIVLAAAIILAAILALAYVAAPFVVNGRPQGSPLHLGLVSVGATLVVALVAALVVAPVAAISLLAGKPLFRVQPRAMLEFDGECQWMLVDAVAQRPLRLIHAWPAFAWVRLRFRLLRPAGSKGTMLELTVWKSSVSSQAWRELRVQLARQAALPGWRAENRGQS